MVKQFLVWLLVLFPGAVMAGACNPSYCEGKITNLYTNGGTGKVFIKMDGDMTDLNCTLSGGYITLKQGNLMFSEIYSSLLAASIAKANIRLRINEGSPDCELNYTMVKD
jgi:hypothetical protein